MADIVISGNTSGSVTLRAPDTSGSTVLTLPTTTGTLVVTGGAQTVQFAAGSAASPSITFTGDTNTGIFSPAADTIAFSEGGVESMRIDSSGNVGIGTTAPSSSAGKLVVSGVANVYGDERKILNLIDTTALATGVGAGISFWGTSESGGGTSQFGSIKGVKENATSANYAGALAFVTSNSSNVQTERMRITSGGNVGIGTSSPNRQLVVYGSSPYLALQNATTGTTDADGFQIQAAGADAYVWNYENSFIAFGTNATERMRITSGGLVGIGTTSPAATLDVGSSISRSGSAQSNIYADYRITAATTGVVSSLASRIVGIGGSTYTIPDVAVYKVEALVAQTGVTITNAYGLYINNMTDPSSGGSVTNPWGIYQTASSNKNYFAGDVLVGTTSWSSGSNGISIGNNSNSRILITNSADFGLELYGGTTNRIGFSASNSSSRVGSITVNTTNTAYNTSSDYRLKENIAPMTGALEKVAQLKPCTYTWKVDGSQGEGFIAHELAEVVPQAVTGEKDGIDKDGNPDYQAIDVSFLVATLTAAIQELNAKVEAQAAEIAALKGVN